MHANYQKTINQELIGRPLSIVLFGSPLFT
jgi:predicted HicB family RNase H-like nuclease